MQHQAGAELTPMQIRGDDRGPGLVSPRALTLVFVNIFVKKPPEILISTFFSKPPMLLDTRRPVNQGPITSSWLLVET